MKFKNILRYDFIEKRVPVIKPTSNECCSNCSGDCKIYIGTNTAKVTNMIEARATSQRNLFSKIKIAINCNIKITYSV